MSKNQKGYTLVEIIIAFTILTISASMMLMSFQSISKIFAEAANIKESTNVAYEEILDVEIPLPESGGDKEEDFHDVPATSITVHFGNGSSVQVAGMYVAAQTANVEEDFSVTLSKMMPLYTAKWLPSDYTEDEDEFMDAKFRLLKTNGAIPTKKNGYEVNVDDYVDIVVVEDALFIDTPNEVQGEENVAMCLNATPDAQSIKDKLFQVNYRYMLGDSYSVIWAVIQTEEEPVTKEDIAIIYGYLVPNVGKYFVLNGELASVGWGFFERIVLIPYTTYSVEYEGETVTISGWEIFFTPNRVFNKPNGVWYIYKR